MVRTGSELHTFNGTLDVRRSNFSLVLYGDAVYCVCKKFTRAFRIHDQEQLNKYLYNVVVP